MKKMKKILAILLAMVMALAMAIPSFAADTVIGNSDDTGTITVYGIEDTTLTDVKAYPIAPAAYDTNGNFSGYTNTYNLADILKPTESELNAIKTTVTGESYTGTSYTLSYDSTKNAYTASNCPVGMYLIVVPSNDSTTYSVAVASITYQNSDGVNIIDPAEVTMYSTTVNTTAAWVKKSVDVTVDKTVDGEKGESSNIGDTLNYQVTINPIPKYSGSYPVLNVVDTLSGGLTYTTNSLTVKVGETTLVADTDYTLTVSGQTITVNFVVNGKYTLNDYAGKSAVISYKAVINDKAALNGNANENDVKLNYTKDSTISGNDTTDEDKTYNYTYTIDGQTSGSITEKILNKYGEEVDKNNNKLPLSGAEFTLYTDEACTTVYTNTEFTGTTTTDSNGQVKITGLKAGTYYLKETKAPTNYSVNTHAFKIEIEETLNSDGTLASWSITIDGTSTTTFTAEDGYTYTTAPETVNGIDIQNTKLSSLPSTGGIGTTIFTVVGCAIIVAAGSLLIVSRRKRNA